LKKNEGRKKNATSVNGKASHREEATIITSAVDSLHVHNLEHPKIYITQLGLQKGTNDTNTKVSRSGRRR
jgi:hypothetical protein